jgi:hypothetical protein
MTPSPASAHTANTDADGSQHEEAPPPRRAAASVSAEPARAAAVGSYGREQKRAVFGRVPRSLSRRLEGAVFELRDEFEDLTQEQVLAALLHEHVDAGDPGVLAELTKTVRRYRRELGRQ